MQNARDNPLAAAAVAAAVQGTPVPPQSNFENLLDIDFDGAAPASAQKSPDGVMSGLEGLAGTPKRVESPPAQNGAPPPQPPMGNMDDLMGLSDMSQLGGLSQSNEDILNGFASLDMSGSSQPPPPPQQQLSSEDTKKTNEDLLGLF